MDASAGGGLRAGGSPTCMSSIRSDADLTVSGPVFFLIKEQAKSLLAIKELQDRVQALEGSRNDIFFAIQDIQQTMHQSANTAQIKLSSGGVPVHSASTLASEDTASPSGSSSKSWTLNPKPRRHKDVLVSVSCVRTKAKGGVCELNRNAVKPSATSLSSRVASTSAKGDTTSVILESDKQDSGLDSDCRDHASRESTLAPKDELLVLLEMIDERGIRLREKVQEMEKSQTSMGESAGSTLKSHSDMLEFHGKELQARLSEMELERANCRTMVRQLQSTIHRLEGEKTAFEHKLQATIYEKKQLEKKVHSLHMQYVRGDPSSLPPSKVESWPTTHSKESSGLSDLEKLRTDARGVKSDEGKAKVSNILRESNPLELKKLLLLYTLENQALQEKANEKDQKWYSKLSDWKTTEASLRTDIQNLIQERDECFEALRRQQKEMRMLQAKYKVLEVTLCTLDNAEHGNCCQETDTSSLRHPPMSSQRLTRSYLPSELDYGEPCYRTQSLPPIFLTQAKNSRLFHHQNVSGLHCSDNCIPESSLEDNAFNNEGMAYELDNTRCQQPLDFTDSPLSSPQKLYRPFWQSRHTGSTETQSNAIRLLNLDDEHREVNSGPQSDMDIICSEFDPLVRTDGPAGRERDRNPKPLDFVDSLDLSIPLKPTKTVALSSERHRRTRLELKYLPSQGYNPSQADIQKHRVFSKTTN